MPYALKFTKTEFNGAKNILASEHVEFVKGGATMDSGEFDGGHVGVGTLVMRSKDSGKFVPFSKDDYDIGDYDTVSVTNVDFDNDGENDMILGEVIVRGSVYTKKLADDDVPKEFKEANPMIQFVEE